MSKKCLIFPVLILPLISGCKANIATIDFSLGFYANEIAELNTNALLGKIESSRDSFFLVTHSGESCSCWTNFKHIIRTYNESRKAEGKEYIPFFSYDTNDTQFDEFYVTRHGIDKISSGYVDFYVIVDGQVDIKYTKSAKIDYEIFENIEKFTEIADRHIGKEPIKNYSFVSYNYVTTNLINKDNNEFVLFTIRSGCGDCVYCMPLVVDPFMKTNGSKIPVLVCDIEQYRNTSSYNDVKSSLSLTSDSPLGYGAGVVPTYQYWKNGVLEDAGVFANDSFSYDEDLKRGVMSESYFDGTRSLKYTTKNLIEEFPSYGIDPYEDRDYETGEVTYFLTPEKEAEFHTPLLNDFLTYYCK